MATPPKKARRRPPHLKVSLRMSSASFARLAIGDYLDEKWGEFCLHAGTALEHLAKAYLASTDPSLVADGRQFDSILHACGKGVHARTPRAQMRTIGAAEALARCGQILPQVANLRPDLDVLVEARNGIVHLGEIPAGVVERSLLALFRASRQILGEVGWSETSYWGKFANLVDTRLNESANAARVKVAGLMAAAEREFEQRYGRLDEDTRTAVLQVLASAIRTTGDEEQLENCPVCGSPALASGSTEVEWKPDYERGDFGEPVVSGVYPEVSFFPGHLHCRACGLDLDGEEEIGAAGVTTSWELMDFDQEALYREFHEENDYF